MFKNATLRQITVVIVTIIAILNLILLIGLFSLGINQSDSNFALYIILIVIVSSLFIFLFVSYILESYIFRKIKLIYSIIGGKIIPEGDSKMPKSGMDTSIDNVDRHVKEWAENTSKEISSLKSLEEYRKQYVGTISHELKTPIFTIQGYIHTLLEGGLFDENINIDYLQRAAKNIDRLQTIVEDLELINSLESDKHQLFMSKFDILQLAREVKQDLQAMADKKEIKIVVEEETEMIPNVFADKNAIRQVLVNLISNSIKYGKPNGTTHINVHNLAETVLVEVEDNGIGIEQKHLKHLFDRFYRVDPSRSKAIGGSGLGLSIVKHIIEAHHQNINVRSQPNVGTNFSFGLEKV